LTALSFVEAIMPDAGPVLDLGCGAGHITWALERRVAPRPVIGFDVSFFSLYVARSQMVPDGNFICGEILALPFRDAVFSLVFCSDAFYFPTNKWPVLREMERALRDDGQLMLVWLRNQVRQHFHDGQAIYSGRPLTLAGYRQLVGHLSYRFIPDSLIVQRYLDGVGLPAGTHATDEMLERELTFSILAAKHDPEFNDAHRFSDWPHARGKLGINPLYRSTTDTSTGVSYVREFPSGVYAEEHAQMRKILPEKFSLPVNDLQALRENRSTTKLRPLIDKLAIMGFPPNYLQESRPAA
jgi:SAM-dependent methyltransferase